MSKAAIGLAELTVALLEGRSVVTEQYSQAPLQLHRPLYLDGDLYPTVFLKTPSSGLLGGDKHQLSVHACPASTIKILNQSATLVYPGASEQQIEIDIAGGATVLFEPCPLIFAAGANLTQTVRIEMAPTSRLSYTDEWSAGRIAMNERWQFERFDNTIEILVGGLLRYRERFILEPVKASPTEPVIGQHFTKFKSVYYFGPWLDSDLPPEYAKQEYLSDQSLNQEYLNQETPSRDSAAQEHRLTWRLKRPWGTVDRLLSASPATQTTAD